MQQGHSNVTYLIGQFNNRLGQRLKVINYFACIILLGPRKLLVLGVVQGINLRTKFVCGEETNTGPTPTPLFSSLQPHLSPLPHPSLSSPAHRLSPLPHIISILLFLIVPSILHIPLLLFSLSSPLTYLTVFQAHVNLSLRTCPTSIHSSPLRSCSNF